MPRRGRSRSACSAAAEPSSASFSRCSASSRRLRRSDTSRSPGESPRRSAPGRGWRTPRANPRPGRRSRPPSPTCAAAARPATVKATIGMCSARIPTSPTAVRVESICSSPLKTSPPGSGTRPRACAPWSAPAARGPRPQASASSASRSFSLRPRRRPRARRPRPPRPSPLLGAGDLVDRALHVEGGLGQIVVAALEDLPEAAHRVGDGAHTRPSVANASATKNGCERKRSSLRAWFTATLSSSESSSMPRIAMMS